MVRTSGIFTPWSGGQLQWVFQGHDRTGRFYATCRGMPCPIQRLSRCRHQGDLRRSCRAFPVSRGFRMVSSDSYLSSPSRRRG